MLTCARPWAASWKASAWTWAGPPELARTALAIRSATAMSPLSRLTLTATSGPRAPTAVAPALGWGDSGPKAGDRNPAARAAIERWPVPRMALRELGVPGGAAAP